MGKHDSEIQELRSAMSQCVQRIQPVAITSLTSSTAQDTSNTSLLSSSNTSSINQPAGTQPIVSKAMVSVASGKEKELADSSSPMRLSGVSPRTSTPYKRQSQPNVVYNVVVTT